MDTTGLTIEQEKAFLEAYQQIDSCFTVVPDEQGSIPFEKFSLLEDYQSVYVRDLFRIADGRSQSFVTFTKVEYKYIGYKGGQYEGEEYRIWGVAILPKDFGHLVIRPETFKDRFIEFLKPLELNFPEDKDFCKRFYVLVNDQEKARRLINKEFREEMKRILISDFSLEVMVNYLLIGNKKLVGKEEALELASFIFNVSELTY